MVDIVCGLLADQCPLVPPNGEDERRMGEWTAADGEEVGASKPAENGKWRRGRGRMVGIGRKRARGRRRLLTGTVTIAVFLLVLALMCVAALVLLLPWTFIDHSFADIPSDQNDLRFVEIQKLCDRKSNNECCAVVDIIDRKRNLARRAMFFNRQNDFESEVPLVQPKGSSVFDSDTRLWLVDSSKLLNEYVAAMALMPFLVSAIGERENENEKKSTISVLIVGLGGGSLDMFLHTKFPWIDLTVYEMDASVIEMAEKWFGVINDGSRRTVFGDGINAFDHRKDDRFDVIIVDACDAGEQQIISCPSASFRNLSTIEKAKSMLKPLGVFVLNVLPTSEGTESGAITEIQRKLFPIFPLCVRMRMDRQLNSIFSCLPYSFPPDDLADILRLWEEKRTKLAKRIGIDGMLEGAKLSIGGGVEGNE